MGQRNGATSNVRCSLREGEELFQNSSQQNNALGFRDVRLERKNNSDKKN